MKQDLFWVRRFVGGLAALVVLTHCGGKEAEPPPSPLPEEAPRETPPEVPQERPPEVPQEPPPEESSPAPAPTDCMARTDEGTPSYCTYRGAGGGRVGWVRTYGGKGPERLQALASDSRGGFVVAGQFGEVPFPARNGFALARYTSAGVPLWTRWVTNGEAEVTALAVTPQGRILVVGQYGGSVDLGQGPLPTAGRLTWDSGLFIAEFSPEGQLVWAKGFVATYDRAGQRESWPIVPRAIATDAQGSLIITGTFHGYMDLGGGRLFAGIGSVPPEWDASSSGFLAKFSSSGQHLWSRVFLGGYGRLPATSTSVATDSVGHVLVGGSAHRDTDLGDGRLGDGGPFIARYDAWGNLLWKRVFTTLYGEVAQVQPLGTDGVAFVGDFVGTFTFAGQTYTAGDPYAPDGVYDTRAFFGTLSFTQGDGWLRALDGNSIWSLITDGRDTLTVSGALRAMDLGGGALGTQSPRPFVARYGKVGEHHWSRVLDGNLEPHLIWGWGTQKGPRLFLTSQPGGEVVIGSHFTSPVQVDGKPYTSHGASDLIYFQLTP